MTASPLVPVPELPWRSGDPNLEVRPDGSQVYIYGLDSLIIVEREDAASLASAILASAGCENHRVIDLGGPLPEVEQSDLGVITKSGGRAPRLFESWQLTSELGVFEDARHALAALEAHAAAPAHDPAEVEAIAIALAMKEGDSLTDIDAYREDARVALDAIAALRAKP